MENPRDLVPRIYAAVESRNLELSVMLSMRLARLLDDHINSLTFMKHLHRRGKSGFRYLIEDMKGFPKEILRFLWDKSTEIWLETHSVSVDLAGEDFEDTPYNKKRNILDITAAEIPDERQQWEATLADLICPSGMSEYDTAAFFDRLSDEKSRIRLRLSALSEIQSKILAYVTHMHLALKSKYISKKLQIILLVERMEL